MASSSGLENTLPIGLCGVLSTIMRVLDVMAERSAGRLTVHSEDEVVSVDPFGGGVRGTYFITPPGISMLDMYWSKKGSKIITSSPGSMKPMNALSIPSFAPVVMVTSVSGLMVRSKKGEYAFAMAFLRRGRPFVGEY